MPMRAGPSTVSTRRPAQWKTKRTYEVMPCRHCGEYIIAVFHVLPISHAWVSGT